MFNNLANYLLGSILNQDQGATAEGVENSSIRLTSVESEDDWVLVIRNRDSEGDSESSSSDSSDSLDIDGPSEFDDREHPLPILTRTSSSSSLSCMSYMEESWFLTPPPCFTSTGPIHMETSPLENLLIEHPSMSVYHQHTYPSRRYINVSIRSASPLSLDDDDDTDDDIQDDEGQLVIVEDVVEEEADEQQQVVAVVNNRSPRVNRLQIFQQIERQSMKNKHAQKMQMQKACKAMKRGYLKRHNKAREVNCRNRRQRRGERSQGATRSYANNNRKC